MIPEILFSPSDIGLEQGGLHEAIWESISKCPKIGGNANLKGLKGRLEKELRALTPSDYSINIYIPQNPSTYAWESGKALCNRFNSDIDLVNHSKPQTRAEYFESGPRDFN
ncbi:Actin-related protein 6 [Smittium culicis]|uniref:Actin-related protein 6 n=1 Tax=Smittium culicis TaxID=133412 RepID=A0A1R1YR50_9FUNG|nr:Actin-related protein 6 [Smittium culicis]